MTTNTLSTTARPWDPATIEWLSDETRNIKDVNIEGRCEGDIDFGLVSVLWNGSGDAEGSRETINVWVSEQTEGLVPQLLPPGFIMGNTVLVLTDAIYFKARWNTVFGKYDDVMDEFTKLDGAKVPEEGRFEEIRGKLDQAFLDAVKASKNPSKATITDFAAPSASTV